MQTSFEFSSETVLIAGVDEVGRGPLAGPVVTAAVILDPARPIHGLADSKAMTEKKRERLFAEIQEKALSWAIGRCEWRNRRAEHPAGDDGCDAACGSWPRYPATACPR